HRNQLSLKVKIIRSDNGTEFKNNDLNQLCRIKGIKREFSIPRTPQQNGIAERKNRTLIKAARTILVDLLLPIPFWAEVVNTACYVQNMVLVTKPQHKTPSELLLGRTPSICFIRPFGCPVTILNTLDPLGKFDGNVDEGFLVGYYVSSKAFRVFNSRTRIVQETLHINFLGNKPNVAGEESVQQYVLFSVWSSGSTHPQNTNGDAAFEVKEPEFKRRKPESEVYVSPRYRNLSAEFEDLSDDSINKVNVANSLVSAVGQISTNSTNTFSAAGPSNVAVSPTHGKSSYVDSSQLPDDPNMPELKDITYSDDEYDVGAEADFNNLETSIIVSPILITRVHKDHHVTQIIGDLSSATQTRKEPKRIHQALKDPSWIKAMQEELLQFKMQKVWVLVNLPHGKRAIGHTQEEGINYEEVFAPVARIEAIRLFLAYASFMEFMVYQMDVKSVFLYGTIKEEVYVYQPSGFEDLDYLNKTMVSEGKIDQTLFIKRQKGDILLVQIYVDDIIFGYTNNDLCKAFEKLMKDKFQMSSMGELTFFLGLQVKQKKDGMFISQGKYVAKILRKFGLTDGKSASTPIDTEKPLLKDPDVEDVDVHTYRSMIGSLMYLTLSRPDIMFAVYACAHFQVTPKASHLHAVKRIFRYLKGKPHLGLWYPKDSPFNLMAYSNSDYAGASLDRKSTIGGCQFLRCRLISWQCKKQTVVPTSSTKAELNVTAVSLSFCCLSSVSVKKVNDVTRLQALVDKKRVIITKATIKDALRLADAEGIDCLPNEKIFTEVGKGCSGVETPLFEGMLVAHQVDGSVAELNDDAVHDAGVADEGVAEVNIDDVPTVVDEPSIPSPPPPTQPPLPSQDLPSTSQAQPTQPPSLIAQPPSPQQQPQPSQDVDISMDLLHNLLDTCTTLTRRVKNLKHDKIAQALEITKLKQRVKRLERRNKLKVSKLRRLKRVGTSQRVKTSDDTVMDDDEVIDHVKRKEKEDNAVKRYQALKRKPQTKAQARKNMMIYLRNKTKEQMEEEDSRALKRISETQEEKAAKKQKLDEEVPFVDYEIYTENNKSYYKIIRADRSPQVFLSFLSLLRNFDREDLEVLWELVKERFASSKPKNLSDDFLLTTLTYMFEKPDVQAQVWKNQRIIHGLAKVKSWRLLESYKVHIITFTSTQMILLVERRYPLTSFGVDAAKDFKENMLSD
nr:hypothetical protein [Tanacetum cinerariifolium]